MQVTSHMIVRDNNDKVKGRGQHDGQTKEEEEIPEAQLRQAERFLRRIMPLMESELNEDLRLYQSRFYGI